MQKCILVKNKHGPQEMKMGVETASALFLNRGIVIFFLPILPLCSLCPLWLK